MLGPSPGAGGWIWWSPSVARGRECAASPQGPVFPSQGGQRTLVPPPTLAWGGGGGLELWKPGPCHLPECPSATAPAARAEPQTRSSAGSGEPNGSCRALETERKASFCLRALPPTCHITLKTRLHFLRLGFHHHNPDRVVLRTGNKKKSEPRLVPGPWKILRTHTPAAAQLRPLQACLPSAQRSP